LSTGFTCNMYKLTRTGDELSFLFIVTYCLL